jgi:hypothetical protein
MVGDDLDRAAAVFDRTARPIEATDLAGDVAGETSVDENPLPV